VKHEKTVKLNALLEMKSGLVITIPMQNYTVAIVGHLKGENNDKKRNFYEYAISNAWT
tara:strand:- start:9931 stop:10104 length:174 start_codon:yes stop_codon:yes gene_type:complete